MSVWLVTEGVAQYEAAEAIGVSPSSLNRIIKGNEVPTAKELMSIFEFTNGHVTIDDWADQYPEIDDWIEAVINCQRF